MRADFVRPLVRTETDVVDNETPRRDDTKWERNYEDVINDTSYA